MNRIEKPVSYAAGFACTATLALVSLAAAQDPPAPSRAAASIRLQPAFVPNLGQWPTDASYVARFANGVTITLEERGFGVGVLEEREDAVHGAGLELRFAGAEDAELVPERRAAGVENHLCGDPGSWRTHVPRYGQVRYTGMYEGVEVLAYNVDGHFEYDVIVAPGASLAGVEIEVDGVRGLRLDPDGDLVFETAAGDVRQPRPRTWQLDPEGARSPIDCEYELLAQNRFGFVAAARDPTAELVVDPGIVYSTHTTGWQAEDVFVDSRGIVTVSGRTRVALPTVGGFQQTAGGDWDAFLAQFDPTRPPGRQLLYTTYVSVGSGRDDEIHGLHVDATGVVTLGGVTGWGNLPVTSGAFQTSHAGGSADAFVMQIDPSRTGLAQVVYATYFGGSSGDVVREVRMDPGGRIVLAGPTFSSNLPVSANAYDSTYGGNRDGFLAILDPSQQGSSQLVYSTYFGGSRFDRILDVRRDAASGDYFVVGDTESFDLPTTTGVIDPTFNGRDDLFVARLDLTQPAASQLVASTYLGGTDADSWGEHPWFGTAIGIDSSGVVTVTGSTDSSDFPMVPGGFDTTYNGFIDVFVVQLDAALGTQLYGTFLGSTDPDRHRGTTFSANGVVTVCGWTQPATATFPTTPGTLPMRGNREGFVARLDPSLPASQQLVYSTFLGGSGTDACSSVQIDASGRAVVIGETASSDFPTTANAHQSTVGGGFLTILDPAPISPPVLSGISPGSVSNHMPPELTLTGSYLIGTLRVTVAGQDINNFTVDSDTQVRFRLPSPFTIANGHAVTVTTTTATSNPVSLDVNGTHPAVLEAPIFAVRGFPMQYRIFGDRGWNALLAVSPVAAPSVVPGVVSLGIGNGFAAIFDAGTYTNDMRGFASPSITYPATLPSNFQVHAQVIHYDLNNLTLPLEVSNTVTTTLF